MITVEASLGLSLKLGIKIGDKVAIVGCGGKTSTMYRLAEENRNKSVLIGTTTHIFPPSKYFCDFETANCDTAKVGVTLISAGVKNGKVLPPNEAKLSQAAAMFDYVFIEADGSKMLPLKGWADHEPVIPSFCTATIGVATPSPVGEILSEKNTLRLPLFCEIAGAKVGDVVTPKHIANMIAHTQGMFMKSVGRKILLINHDDNQKSYDDAIKIINCLPESFKAKLAKVVAFCLNSNNQCQREGGNYD